MPGANFELSTLLQKPVPRIRIVSPTAHATVTGHSPQVELTLEDTPVPVKLIRIQVKGAQIADFRPDQGLGFKPGTLKLPVKMVKGSNVIRIIAVNQDGLETPADVAVTHDGAGALD